MYKNQTGISVQLAFFDNTDWKSERSYWNQIPLFSALVEAGEKWSVELPHDNFQLLVFDAEGKVLENKAIRN